jgi:hypothetical protein
MRICTTLVTGCVKTYRNMFSQYLKCTVFTCTRSKYSCIIDCICMYSLFFRSVYIFEISSLNEIHDLYFGGSKKNDRLIRDNARNDLSLTVHITDYGKIHKMCVTVQVNSYKHPSLLVFICCVTTLHYLINANSVLEDVSCVTD